MVVTWGPTTVVGVESVRPGLSILVYCPDGRVFGVWITNVKENRMWSLIVER